MQHRDNADSRLHDGQPGIKIVDAHFHLWDLDENYYPWLSDAGAALSSRTSRRCAGITWSPICCTTSATNVIAGVHIQAEHDYRDRVRETRWLQRVADSRRREASCRESWPTPISQARMSNGCWRSIASSPIRGDRYSLNRRLGDAVPYDPLRNPVWVRNFRCYAIRLSSIWKCSPSQQDLAIIRFRKPQVQIVLTHAAMPLWQP